MKCVAMVRQLQHWQDDPKLEMCTKSMRLNERENWWRDLCEYLTGHSKNTISNVDGI